MITFQLIYFTILLCKDTQEFVMKNLLIYQTSEYDCGPVCLINAIRYLFDREEIYPDLVKFIMLYCMDSYNDAGEPCKHGTSPAAMNYMANWLNHFGQCKGFPIHCEYLSKDAVSLTHETRITNALREGGVVVLRLFLDVPHYVLLTGVEDGQILVFDPYYEEADDPELDEEYSQEGISFVWDQPKKANRRISIERLDKTGHGYYEMGEAACREALILRRTKERAV